MNNVDTKTDPCAAFGNDTIGFIRVRKRKLKGGYARRGILATTSASFDLVRAVRVNGKPRHEFVLGLGSQKNNARGRDAAFLLLVAVGRMKRHGLDQPQRQALLNELIRKGVFLPTIAECEGWDLTESWIPYVDES